MNCREKGCHGEIDLKNKVILIAGSQRRDVAFPCRECSALYWGSGSEVFQRGGRAFLKDGKVELRDHKTGEIVVADY